MSFKNPFAAKEPARGVNTMTTKDTEPINRVHREHVISHIQLNLSVLSQNNWISPQTEDLIISTLSSHNLEVEVVSTSHTAHSTVRVQSNSNQPPPLYRRPISEATSVEPPPLPSREPYRPTPNPPSSNINAPPPIAPKPFQSPASSTNNLTSTLTSNPAFQKAALSAASNPALQKAAFSAASNPGVQKAAYQAFSDSHGGGAGSVAGNPDVQRAAFAAASNPAVQKAAYSAATNPAVQNAAYNAATNPAVQRAANGAVSGALSSAGFGGIVGGGSAAAGKKKMVVATADFEGAEDGDLSFRMGDLITILEDVDENWYRGELKGRQGIFPKNHVQSK